MKRAVALEAQHGEPKPDQKKLQALWNAVVAWRDEHEVSCPEALVQVDSVNEDLPSIAESILNIVGYWKE